MASGSASPTVPAGRSKTSSAGRSSTDSTTAPNRSTRSFFRDADNTHYLIYGGWRHCNIARLNDDFDGFVPFDDGATFREITPEGYVEGSFMLQKDGRYYFMWSEGGWTGPNYAVAYAAADSPLGVVRDPIALS